MSQEVTNEEDTAAYKIFHSRYQCRVTAAFCVNVSSVDEWGHPTTGSRDVDMDISSETVLTYRTIAELASLLGSGSHIQLSNPSDALRIYNIVREYLKDQARLSSANAMVIKYDGEEKDRMDRVLEDIQLLVDLVNALQDKAKMVLNTAPIKNMLFGFSGKNIIGGGQGKFSLSKDNLPDDPLEIFTENITSSDLRETTKVLEWQQ